jgi:uncharacterized coiled-coil DUF342 family protein
MLQQAEINKLLDKFDAVKKQIKDKKQELNKLNSQKEGWFKKKKDVTKQIHAKIDELRASKKKVTTIDKEVTSLKTEKDAFSDEIKKIADEVKNLKQQYKDACVKYGVKENPKFLKKKIDKLEYALEISAIGFEQEKKINKEIKKLKKVYSKISEVSKIWSVINKKEKEISKLKNKKFGTLNRLKADNSEKYNVSEDFINNSKEIMDFRKTEEEYFTKFSELKDQFRAKNDEFKELIKKKDELTIVLQQNNVEMDGINKKAQAELIREKSAEVKEKMKKREKLTTEDLLIFQGSK